jgi:hypothetical protein
MSIKHLCLIAVAAILGCAGSGTSGTPGSAAVPRRGNLLTGEEIVAAKADVGNAYDAIARLRGNWLSSRGAGSFNTEGVDFAVVFVDGQRYGELLSLRNIPAYHVAEVRYYNPAEAGGIFGIQGGTAGVIDVKMHLKGSTHRP